MFVVPQKVLEIGRLGGTIGNKGVAVTGWNGTRFIARKNDVNKKTANQVMINDLKMLITDIQTKLSSKTSNQYNRI